MDGQDGSYLAEHFLKNNFLVTGIGRRSENPTRTEQPFFKYKSIDLSRPTDLRKALIDIDADTIIYCASTHGPNGFDYFKVADDTFAVNSYAPHVCLNYCRETDRKCSFIFLSSIKVFDHELHRNQDANPWLCRKATDLYSRSKILVEDSIEFYRRTYGVSTAVVWLSNHESIRRIDSKYFLPFFVTQCHKAIKLGKGKINVRTLDFYCDWGCANQFMKIVFKKSQKQNSKDLFIGTGQFVYARDLVKEFLERLGYDYKSLILEKFNGDKTAIRQSYSFNKEWLPDRKTQNNLLGPKSVLDNMYDEYLKYMSADIN